MASSFVLGHTRLFRHGEEEKKALLISANGKKYQILNRFEETSHYLFRNLSTTQLQTG